MSVLLSSLNLFFISINSDLRMFLTLSSLAKISFRSLINSSNSTNSASILSLSRPVNLLSFNSRIA